MGGAGCVRQEKEWMGCLRGGTFHGEMDRCRESQGWTTACSSIRPNVTRRAKERIAQSKRARAGSLVIVDYSKVARTCILRGFFPSPSFCFH